jgi:pseudouridine kinase
MMVNGGENMKKVVVIGGAVVDLFLYPDQKMILHDSNPGYMKQSLGGVGRNIAENLARLSVETHLISVIGNDEAGDWIRRASAEIGLHLSIIESEKTPMYFCVMDETKEDLVSVAVMKEIEKLTHHEIEKRLDLIQSADLVVIDTNLSEKAFAYACEHIRKPLFVDAISTQKVIKIRKYLHYIHTLKLNAMEAEVLTGMTFETMDDLNDMGDFLIQAGVKQVLITLGATGAYYANHEHAMFKNAIPVDVKNGTGAGDAFIAGAIYAHLNDLHPLSVAMANAMINLESESAVSTELSEDLLIKTMKEYA